MRGDISLFKDKLNDVITKTCKKYESEYNQVIGHLINPKNQNVIIKDNQEIENER